MAVEVATLIARLEADVSSLKRDLGRAQKDLDAVTSSSSKAGRGLGSLTDAAGRLGKAVGVAALAKMAFDATQLAVDAEEAAAAFNTTFGPAVADVNKFVEEFANQAGLAEFELQQMMATTGNVIQGLGGTEAQAAAMSEQMARLAGDVASFTNAAGGSEAVLKALQSATVGEREALKTYGIVVSEAEVQQRALADSGKTAVSELTKLEKAQATLTIATERAGKAVGDLERTQDSTANTQRRLAAQFKELQVSLGEALIPILDVVLDVVEALLPAFKALIPIVKTVVEVVMKLVGPLLKLVEVAADVVALLPDVGTAASDVAAELVAAAEAQAVHNAELQKGVTVLHEAERQADDTAQSEADLAAAIELGGRVAQDSSLRVAIYQHELRGVADAAAEAARKQRAARDATLELLNAQRRAADPVFNLFAAQKRLTDTLTEFEKVSQDRQATDADILAAQLDVIAATGDLKFAQGELGATIGESTEAFRRMAEAAGLSGEAIADLIRLMFGLADAPALPGGRVITTASGATFRGLQGGGPVAAGEPVIVGERGPELFIPTAGGRVSPGATSTITVGTIEVRGVFDFMDPAGGRRAAEAIQRELEALAAENI